MNICVYGAAGSGIEEKFFRSAEELGEKMAERGHSLVFGGGSTGVMGSTAKGILDKGGKAIGVAPHFFRERRVLEENCTKMYYTDTMRERKLLLQELSDAFVVAPGGVGTMDEFFEILTLKQLGRHAKPIVIWNVHGYYNTLLTLLEEMKSANFIYGDTLSLFRVFENTDEMLAFLEDDGDPSNDVTLN